MFDITNLWAFLAAASLVIITPGPATFYVIGKAQRSSRTASRATLGIVAGDVILITASGLGFASLISRWPVLLLAIKLAGAFYLLYLGWNLINSKPHAPHARNEQNTSASNNERDFIKGMLITLINPKPILFFAAFFPLFIPAGNGAAWRSFYALGLLFEMVNLCYFAILILVVAQLRRHILFEHFLEGGFNVFSGIALTACSALILISVLR